MAPDRQITVMIVDDDRHLRTTMTDFLRFEGYEVITAANGKQALAALQTIQPDIILLDIMMPGMDGGDVAQAIRAKPDLKDIPIIFTTAAVSKSEERLHGGQIGGESYLAKPFELDELTMRIREALPNTE